MTRFAELSGVRRKNADGAVMITLFYVFPASKPSGKEGVRRDLDAVTVSAEHPASCMLRVF